LSKQVRNLTVYYENYGFQARASLRSRSPFLGEIQGFGADRSFVYIDSEQVIDLQTGYTFHDDNWLNGTTILLQVNNATDERYRQYFNNSGLTQYYSKYGRQYLLGITYKF
jgi:iron complex outermembrane receptor protein